METLTKGTVFLASLQLILLMPAGCGIARLVGDVRSLLADERVRRLVDARVREFIEAGGGDDRRWFEELVFCILTANSSAEMGLKCVEALKARGLLFKGGVKEVSDALKVAGHRYPVRRAEYIVEARRWMTGLKERVLGFRDAAAARRWLVRRFRGIGWKEASHFLRNVGIFDVAIIDRHVQRLMHDYNIIPRTTRHLTGSRYLQYENILRGISREVGVPLGVLDLYLWYMRTGKVLK